MRSSESALWLAARGTGRPDDNSAENADCLEIGWKGRFISTLHPPTKNDRIWVDTKSPQTATHSKGERVDSYRKREMIKFGLVCILTKIVSPTLHGWISVLNQFPIQTLMSVA